MNPWGPIIAAMIAGFIAFIGMIITKENKVSEFRQVWINEFREEVSFLIEAYKKWTFNKKLYDSHMGIAHIYLVDSEQAKTFREKSQWYDETLLDASNEMERYKGRIKLRLNSDINRRKKPENELDALLDKLKITTDLVLADALSREIYFNSSLILSTEWKVVKKGEESYIKSKKFILFLAVLVGVIGLIGFCFHLEEALKWLMNNPSPLKAD